ncbi:short-chain fatty acyl-CoA regulator family protein [Yoonia sp. 2307UL14-13]|uniref:short-chain fatty acyl-CoA regulator family protein n=1 Tax=Yoonia sp. 2307UL14-13 TaxID=3126506 RepID=UPI00309BBB06
MPPHRLTGSRIREKRLDQGLKQAAVALDVGISPSYLNLIEHNRRRIGGKLLGDLARVLGVDPIALSEGADSDLLDRMHAATARFGDMAEVARAEDLAGRYPGWAALIAAQEQRITTLEEQIRTLSDRMAYDPHLSTSLHEVISAVTAIRSSAAILVEQEQLDPDWQRRFHQNIDADSRRLAQSSEALIAYLDKPEPAQPNTITPLEEVEIFITGNGHQFTALEADDADIASFVSAADLSQPATRLLQIVADIYHADAVAMPRAQFDPAARDAAYDPVALAMRFNTGFAAILRRLSTLLPDDGHPPMALAVCDASGALTFLKSVPGFALPRFGGACPLWPLFGAFARPAQPLHAVVEMPGTLNTQMLCYAIAAPVGPPRLNGPQPLQSTMLVLPDPPSLAPHPIPVGTSCRICPRNRCDSRREPAIAGIGSYV